MRRPPVLAVLLLLACALSGAAAPRSARAEGAVRGEGTVWADWTPATFARAKREGRILVVEVSAAWCHWCHVMERETYADPRVVARLSSRFLPVKVDADARPDLAERYAEYHWPATVFLTPDAATVTALRGYRGPEDFLRILDEVEVAARDGRVLAEVGPPTGGPVRESGAAFLPALRARLTAQLDAVYDAAQGGWGFGQKYPFAPCVLHALLEARLSPGTAWRERAVFALAQWEHLLDPVWGGMYQYSEGGVWTAPHFEKIASVQAGALSAFASAHRLAGDPRWLRDAFEVRRFLTGMLRSPSGAFYTSQDADVGAHGDVAFVDGHAYFVLDDASRRRLGLPRIDRAVYAQENGQFIEGLCDLHRASGDESVLGDALGAARAILASHVDPAGGVRHAASDRGVLHLGDQAHVGRAWLALFDATGDRAWLDGARRLADAMIVRFLDRSGGGFYAQTEDASAVGVFRDRIRPFEGNASAARFLLRLHAVTGKAVYRTEALRAIASVAAPELAERFGWRASTLLLAVEEASFPFVHATLVASDDDPAARSLEEAMRLLDAPLLVRERLAPGAESIDGTSFPPAPAPAIYLCGDGRCSSPVRRAADLPAAYRAFARR